MYKIMSNRCAYPEINYEALEPTILVEENVIWENHDNDSMQEHGSIHYADAADCTIADTGNDSYVTVNSDNTTQYFSVLDSSEQTILNDVSNDVIDNSVIHETIVEDNTPEETNVIDINNGQIVIVKVDGTNELYGIQLVHDEEGNLQKYQFKVRQNAEGNLEAIPETLQIVPVDNLVNEEVTEEVTETNDQSLEVIEDSEQVEEEHGVLVKQEHYMEQCSEFNEEEIYEEQLDTKEGILDVVPTITAHKQEVQDDVQEEEVDEVDETTHEYAENVTAPAAVHDDTDSEAEQGDEEQEEEPEIFYTHGDDGTNENAFAYNEDDPVAEEEIPAPDGHYEELFVRESHVMETANGPTEQNGLEEVTVQESDNEEYETVDGGVHVTGDAENIRKSPSYVPALLAKKRIVKNVVRKVRIQKSDGKGNLFYFVKKEKENVGQVPSNSIAIRPNPRSILKCSVAAAETQRYDEEEEKYDKRFAKSKEAQQARQFNNFIAQTKIIRAPVRQGRLPRKQQIKPMTRTDEEIVVQEVVVSSNGFIETSEEGVLKERVPIKPTEYIQLSDSDEDFDPRAPHKRKRRSKRRKPTVEITISDSELETSDTTPDDAEDDCFEIPASVKRPRGRPPKDKEEKETAKRPRGRPPKNPKPPLEEEIIVIKIDNKCPKCPKSFPSEGSLRSHMQCHNFSQARANDARYICEKCGEIFKNSFLLNRHIDSHNTSNIVCRICEKVFVDQAQLARHQKTHVKRRLIKNTTVPKDSPKLFRNTANRCEECRKVFPTASALSIHKKQHRHIFCESCKDSFTSQFTFNSHLRRGCVKRRRFPRKSAIPVTKKEEMKPPPAKPIPTRSAVITNIKCDSCSMTFATYTSLFKHKVLKHGLDTPDTSVTRATGRKSSYNKNKAAHSGVRPSIGLKNAFAGLQTKLETLKNSQKRT